MLSRLNNCDSCGLLLKKILISQVWLSFCKKSTITFKPCICDSTLQLIMFMALFVSLQGILFVHNLYHCFNILASVLMLLELVKFQMFFRIYPQITLYTFYFIFISFSFTTVSSFSKRFFSGINFLSSLQCFFVVLGAFLYP